MGISESPHFSFPPPFSFPLNSSHLTSTNAPLHPSTHTQTLICESSHQTILPHPNQNPTLQRQLNTTQSQSPAHPPNKQQNPTIINLLQSRPIQHHHHGIRRERQRP